MRTRTASQPGTPPAAIHTAGAFIVQPADVNGHSLQQEGGALSDRLIPSLGELVEELLMAVNGTGRTGGPELWLERKGVTQGFILTPRRGGRVGSRTSPVLSGDEMIRPWFPTSPVLIACLKTKFLYPL